MRSRWYHRPILHTEHDSEKRVSWIELFYDLVFVAAIIQLGDALGFGITEHEGAAAVGRFAVHFVALLIAWMGVTFYANRFDIDDFIHRGLVFAQMFAMGTMAITAPAAMRAADPQPVPFALAFAIAQLLVAAMYLRAWRHGGEARPYVVYWGAIFAIGAVIILSSTVLPEALRYPLWLLAPLVVLGAPVSKYSRALSERLPIDQEHLAERFGLLTIIVLGESFVKVLSQLTHDGGAQATSLLQGALNLLITCCVWWIYFDDVAVSKVKKGIGNWILWLYGHVPLTLGITALGVALKKAVVFSTTQPADADYRWFLVGALGLTLGSVAAVDSVTERRHAVANDRLRSRVRFASTLLVLALGPIGGVISGRLFIWLITAVCVGQIVLDIIMAPQAEGGEAVKATSISDLARAGQVGLMSRLPRRDVFESVRQGGPASLRSDFYYFFLEGSWARLFVFFGLVYLAINVFFAGLFLLDADAIVGGDGSFGAAFSLSVQTMSTIGYGVLHPGTPYGDLIVTIEAAVGLIAAALATGLVFAKVSRPVSGVLFSEVIVVATMHGQKTLSFRIGNARGSEIVEASITVSVIFDEISPEGHHMRRLHDLKLTRARSQMFALSWTVMHVIDETSPLWGLDWTKAAELAPTLVASMTGHDATYGQTTHARHTYYAEDYRIDHHFVDVISSLEDGRLMIDYAKFHLTMHQDEVAARTRAAQAAAERPAEGAEGGASS